jgi:uncharacterized membrane protein
MMQQTTAGAARVRRAGFDRQRVSHLPLEPNPVLIQQAQRRAQSVENRVADRITASAGSMRFVYIHILWFACWIGFGVEKYPYGLLTMIVSLEAIFLSTFVMISQNRADAKRQVIADQQWQTVKDEDRQNQELLELSHQILELTKAIHAVTTPRPAEVEPALHEAPQTQSEDAPENVEATRYSPLTATSASARPSTGPS